MAWSNDTDAHGVGADGEGFVTVFGAEFGVWFLAGHEEHAAGVTGDGACAADFGGAAAFFDLVDEAGDLLWDDADIAEEAVVGADGLKEGGAIGAEEGVFEGGGSFFEMVPDGSFWAMGAGDGGDGFPCRGGWGSGIDDIEREAGEGEWGSLTALEMDAAAVHRDEGIEAGGVAVLEVFGFEGVLVVPIGSELDTVVVTDTAEDAHNGCGAGAHTATDGDIRVEADIDAGLEGEVEAIEDGNEGELEEGDGLMEDVTDSEAAIEEGAVIFAGTAVDFAEGAEGEGGAAVGEVCEVEGDQATGMIFGDKGLGVAVDGHCQCGAAINDGVFAGKDKFAGCDRFHGGWIMACGSGL